MEAELIQLLKFADEAIGRYITFYISGMAAIAILVMTEGYKRNFKPFGKILLTLALAGAAAGDWITLIYYHNIYNATVTALQSAVIDIDYLFGPDHGALQFKPLWNVHTQQIAGGVIGLSLIWWIEINNVIRSRFLNWWRTRRRLTRK